MNSAEPLDRAEAETYAAWFRALSDGTRVQVVSLLARAGQEHLKIAYTEALRERYLWHEFGDVHLILP